MPNKSMSGRRTLSTRRFSELFNSNEQMNNLYKHAIVICELNEKLHKHLAQPLSSHCNVINYSDETLTVNADTSAWATKLRYCIPDILDFAKQKCGLTQLRTVRIGVSPSQNETKHGYTVQTKQPRNSQVRSCFLSKNTADFMKNIASSIHDPALRKSILKLSNHTK